MKKFLLVVANYKDQRQEIFDKIYSERNKEYCYKHGYEYVVSPGIEIFRSNPTWWKFTVPQKLINDGVVKDGDTILHLDADMIYHDINIEYPHVKPFTYAIDNGNSHCMGNYTLRVCDWSRKLIENILDESLWNTHKDSDLWKLWREQAAWYTLAGIPRHSWVDFRILPHKGWHQTDDQTRQQFKYSLKELYENVDVLGPEWNSTILSEDRDSIPEEIFQYYISKSSRKNCIIRHFAAGQAWRTDY